MKRSMSDSRSRPRPPSRCSAPPRRRKTTHHQVRAPEPQGPPDGDGHGASSPSWWPPSPAARSRSTSSPAARWAATQPNVSAAAGRHDRDVVLLNSGILACAGQGLRGLRLPVPVRQRQGSRRGGRRPVRPEDARQAGRQGHGRPGLLRTGLSQHHQQQAADQQGGRHRRPEAARDPQRDQRRLGQGAGRQPDAAGLPRAVRRARAEGGRRPGEPAVGDPGQQVLRGAEVPDDHQPPVQPAVADRQQEVLGHAERRREEDPAGRRQRGREVPAPGQSRQGRGRPRCAEEGRHAGDRAVGRRGDQAARQDQAGDRQARRSDRAPRWPRCRPNWPSCASERVWRGKGGESGDRAAAIGQGGRNRSACASASC